MINPFYERRGLHTYCDGRRGVNIRQLFLFMSAAALKTTVIGAAALKTTVMSAAAFAQIKNFQFISNSEINRSINQIQ